MNELNHIAIIMDGNGRWAKERNLKRTKGHKEGVKKVREIAIYANKLGIKCLTLYAFSTENWKRSLNEVNYIMSLPKIFFKSYLKELMKNNIKVMMIGDNHKIPKETKEIFKEVIKKTANNTGMILNFAVNYGGRDEIIKACQKYAKEYVKDNKIKLNEDIFNAYLYTKDLPEIDMMIRTSNEYRISNFLLYQIAYSELFFIDRYWPDFRKEDLDYCINEYMKRRRRFGGVDEKEIN